MTKTTESLIYVQSVTAALLKLAFSRNNKTFINYKWIKNLDVMSHWHLQEHEWVLGALCCETEAEHTRKHILPHVRSAGHGRCVIVQDSGWGEGQNGKQLRETLGVMEVFIWGRLNSVFIFTFFFWDRVSLIIPAWPASAFEILGLQMCAHFLSKSVYLSLSRNCTPKCVHLSPWRHPKSYQKARGSFPYTQAFTRERQLPREVARKTGRAVVRTRTVRDRRDTGSGMNLWVQKQKQKMLHSSPTVGQLSLAWQVLLILYHKAFLCV